jgi:hypothetical protein
MLDTFLFSSLWAALTPGTLAACDPATALFGPVCEPGVQMPCRRFNNPQKELSNVYASGCGGAQCAVNTVTTALARIKLADPAAGFCHQATTWKTGGESNSFEH